MIMKPCKKKEPVLSDTGMQEWLLSTHNEIASTKERALDLVKKAAHNAYTNKNIELTITSFELAEEFCLSYSQARHVLSELRQEGKVISIGSNPKYWIPVEEKK